MQTVIPYIQIVVSILLIIVILVQRSGAQLGGAFGGSGDAINYTRRGAEKHLFRATIILSVLFLLLALLGVLL